MAEDEIAPLLLGKIIHPGRWRHADADLYAAQMQRNAYAGRASGQLDALGLLDHWHAKWLTHDQMRVARHFRKIPSFQYF